MRIIGLVGRSFFGLAVSSLACLGIDPSISNFTKDILTKLQSVQAQAYTIHGSQLSNCLLLQLKQITQQIGKTMSEEKIYRLSGLGN